MNTRLLAALSCLAASVFSALAVAAPPMPAEVLAAVRDSGVPLRHFGFYAQPV